MRIAIDARFYGLENTALGRYTNNVLNYFFRENDQNTYLVFVSKKYANLKFKGKVQIVPVEVKH